MKKILPYIKDFTKKADMYLFALSMICSLFGIVAISSAAASLGSSRYLIVQCSALLIGIVLFILFTIVDVDVIADKWAVVLAFETALVLLLLTPLGSGDSLGNRAWLRIGFVGIQPAEINKILFIIVLARQVNYLKEYKNLNAPLSIGQLVLHCVFVIGLLLAISKDMGSGLIYLFIFAMMLFAAGVRFYWFLAGLAVMAAAFPLFWTHVLTQRYRDRILAPYDATIDPNGFDIRWQTNQSRIALASGQLTGRGLFQGHQTQSGALPEKQTDFIFSAIGEELGMIACIIVILLLVLIIFRCIHIGIKSNNTMNMIICFAVAGWLMAQTFENIGMCIGIAPVIGITLPFFSYGGSSMIAVWAAMGVVSGIKYRPKPERFRSLG